MKESTFILISLSLFMIAFSFLGIMQDISLSTVLGLPIVLFLGISIGFSLSKMDRKENEKNE